MPETPLESAVQARLIGRLHELGYFVCKLNLVSIGGFPDLFAAKDGVVTLIECKRPGGKPRPLQLACHRQLLNHGVRVIVYDGTTDITDMI